MRVDLTLPSAILLESHLHCRVVLGPMLFPGGARGGDPDSTEISTTRFMKG